MKKINLYLLIVFLLFSGLSGNLYADTPQSGKENNKTYLILPEDVLEISVWKEEGLQREVIVRPDGKLSFPLVGHIQAAGKTPEQLERIVTDRIKKYISDPVVNVSVSKVAGNKIYILGKVAHPGVYVVGQFVDVIQALSLAGGLTAYASPNNIKIIRRATNKELVFFFNYSEVEDGERLDQNIQLKSGDVVIVP